MNSNKVAYPLNFDICGTIELSIYKGRMNSKQALNQNLKTFSKLSPKSLNFKKKECMFVQNLGKMLTQNYITIQVHTTSNMPCIDSTISFFIISYDLPLLNLEDH